jgi:hypothetical protein
LGVKTNNGKLAGKLGSVWINNNNNIFHKISLGAALQFSEHAVEAAHFRSNVFSVSGLAPQLQRGSGNFEKNDVIC